MEERSVQLSTGVLQYFRAGEGKPLLYLHPAGGVRRSKVLEGLGQSFSLYVPVMFHYHGPQTAGQMGMTCPRSGKAC